MSREKTQTLVFVLTPIHTDYFPLIYVKFWVSCQSKSLSIHWSTAQ